MPQHICLSLVFPVLTHPVDPSDIADAAYELISHTPAGSSATFVVSDWATGNDWIAALTENGIERLELIYKNFVVFYS
ncbi:hypothetical protein KSC_070910 [Ktedonobacter sp. SOSP1-52]|uniref:hypothetical protein n=1 Tax=Ktedonobacter sp. SOSP1-52 TaxID=2778366 RepID=UPI0019158800|nr:hypothetical protein [Ktedonobacter sp. SOSP1-52]GHO68199.1 hypothetical protein KSC_070910 [Ktedonobacter sp. SOSP1-52]